MITGWISLIHFFQMWNSACDTGKLNQYYKQRQYRQQVSCLAEHFFVDCEGEVKHVSDVVVFHPHERLIELLVDKAQIGQVAFGTQQHLVQRSGEKRVEEAVVDQAQAYDAASEAKPARTQVTVELQGKHAFFLESRYSPHLSWTNTKQIVAGMCMGGWRFDVNRFNRLVCRAFQPRCWMNQSKLSEVAQVIHHVLKALSLIKNIRFFAKVHIS